MDNFAGLVALIGAAAAGIVVGVLLTGAALVVLVVLSLMWVDDDG
jgi:hypothetical protein